MALIRALALRPLVLLLDEATGALDEDSTARVEAVLRAQMTRGVTVVMVTHSAPQATRLGNRHLRMQDRHLAPA